MTAANNLLTRRAVLQAAMETTYGVLATVGVNDALLIEDPEFEADVDMLERNFLRDDISPMAGISGRKLSTVRFSTEFRGSGNQNLGTLASLPLITRLFRACGYAITLMPTRDVFGPLPLGDHGNKVTWVTGGTRTNTEVVAYYVEVTTGGASGTAQVTVTSDTAGEGSAAGAITTGTPKPLGTKGLTITPTFTGNLVAGQKWVVWLLPIGARLNPVSTGFESISLVLNRDGVRHQVPGAFGTFDIEMEAGQIAKINWEFTGLFTKPTDLPMPTPNYETTLPPRVELARLRIDGFSAIVARATFDQANEIAERPDVNSADGIIGIRITSRAPEGGIDPEAELVSDFDFWGRLADAQRMPFQMRVGQNAGNTCWLLAPSTQYTGLSYQDRDGILAYDAGLKYSRTLGNDEVCFVFC